MFAATFCNLTKQQYIQLGVRGAIASNMVGGVVEGEILEVELRENVGEDLYSREIEGIYICIAMLGDRPVVETRKGRAVEEVVGRMVMKGSRAEY